MADDKGSSDLDVFEGLAKKGPRSTMPGMVPPPPSGGVRKGTLLGGIAPLPPPVGGVAPLPPPPGSLPAPPSMTQTRSGIPLPPPPGAGPASLPLPPPSALPLPPPLSGAAVPLPPPVGSVPLPPPPGAGLPVPLPPPVAPPGEGASAKPHKGVDMDWDDEEESTHVFGEGGNA
ncbi:MAG TPA: hypothetical protein PK156_28850, partial [Polyangium sp.]|nr:hypothetical protein [Polyangium sp.]